VAYSIYLTTVVLIKRQSNDFVVRRDEADFLQILQVLKIFEKFKDPYLA